MGASALSPASCDAVCARAPCSRGTIALSNAGPESLALAWCPPRARPSLVAWFVVPVSPLLQVVQRPFTAFPVLSGHSSFWVTRANARFLDAYEHQKGGVDLLYMCWACYSSSIVYTFLSETISSVFYVSWLLHVLQDYPVGWDGIGRGGVRDIGQRSSAASSIVHGSVFLSLRFASAVSGRGDALGGWRHRHGERVCA